MRLRRLSICGFRGSTTHSISTSRTRLSSSKARTAAARHLSANPSSGSCTAERSSASRVSDGLLEVVVASIEKFVKEAAIVGQHMAELGRPALNRVVPSFGPRPAFVHFSLA